MKLKHLVSTRIDDATREQISEVAHLLGVQPSTACRKVLKLFLPVMLRVSRASVRVKVNIASDVNGIEEAA